MTRAPPDMSERAFRRALSVSNENEEAPAAAVLVPRADVTPTSTLLPTVQEHNVTSRRRRHRKFAVEPSGFPTTTVAGARSSKGDGDNLDGFGGAYLGHSPKANISDNCFSSPAPTDGLAFQENDRIVAAMNPEEVEEAVAQVRERLSPELFHFLETRARRQGRIQNTFSTDIQSPVTRSNDNEENNFSSGSTTNASWSSTGLQNPLPPAYPSSYVQPLGDHDGDGGQHGPLLSEVRQTKAFAGQVELARTVAEVLSLKHIPEEEGGNDKLAWTNAMETAAAGTGSHDTSLQAAAISKSMEALGHVSEMRFDLLGRKLSDEEVRNLPVHLGLHHHGTDPDSAGYTVGDLLLLARSSVLGQRSIALKVIAALVMLHGDDVIPALDRSGGLSVILSQCLPSALHSSRMHHMSLIYSYLELVRALIDMEHGTTELTAGGLMTIGPEQFYFASRLYAASFPDRRANAILSEMSQSKCAVHLIRAGAVLRDTADKDSVLRAFEACREIVSCSTDAARILAEDKPCMNILMEFATWSFPEDTTAPPKSKEQIATHTSKTGYVDCNQFSPSDSTTAMDPARLDANSETSGEIVRTSCDILGSCIAAHGWATRSTYDDVISLLTQNDRLVALQGFINWFGGKPDVLLSVPVGKLSRACGSMRILRAAMAFGHCVDVCAGAISGLATFARIILGASSCPILDEAAIEAFLTLEAYAYAIFSGEMEHRGSSDTRPNRDMNVPSEALEAVDDEKLIFTKEQLLWLLPLAIECATTFTGPRVVSLHPLASSADIRFAGVRAAAGHFVATVLAMTSGEQVFLSADVVERVCSVASYAENEARLAVKAADGTETRVMVSCSMVHAAARILPRATPNISVVETLLENMMKLTTTVCGIKSSTRTWDAVSYLGKADERSDMKSGSSRWSATCQSVVANATSELLGIASRNCPSVRTVQWAFELLTVVRDPQVSADIVGRCILNTRVLVALCSDLDAADAVHVVEELLPMTLTSLLAAAPTDEGACHVGLQVPLECAATGLLRFWLHAGGDLQQGLAIRLLDALHVSGVLETSIVYCALVLRSDGSMLLDGTSSLARGIRRTVERCCDGLRGAPGRGDGLPRAAWPRFLPGAPATAVNAISTARAKPLVDKFLELADALVAHGPSAESSSSSSLSSSWREEGGHGVLASVVCSAILCVDADASLRRVLWERCVVECGGLALFAGAAVFGSCAPGGVVDALLGAYVSFLAGDRGCSVMGGAGDSDDSRRGEHNNNKQKDNENEEEEKDAMVGAGVEGVVWGAVLRGLAAADTGASVAAAEMGPLVSSARGRARVRAALARYPCDDGEGGGGERTADRVLAVLAREQAKGHIERL